MNVWSFVNIHTPRKSGVRLQVLLRTLGCPDAHGRMNLSGFCTIFSSHF